MSDNAFDAAIDDVEDEQTDDKPASEDEELEAFFEAMDASPMEGTIGLSATTELTTFYKQLKQDDSVDVDPAEQLREHLRTLARRHPEIARDAMQIHKIQNK